jgi:hypothetical protein
MNTSMPPLNTSLPANTDSSSISEPTQIPKTPRLKACNLVPGQPSLDAVFPQDARKFTQNPNDPYIYYTEKLGKFEPTENGILLFSGPESAAIAALRSDNSGSVIAVRSQADGEFSLLLLEADVIKNPGAEHKNGVKLGLQVNNQDQNNATVIYIKDGEMKGIASFEYPLRRETLITIDTASHKLTVQDAQGDVIFRTKIPDSINSSDSYWVIGDPATDNQGVTTMLLKEICYLDPGQQ